jgi:hypothetical protein
MSFAKLQTRLREEGWFVEWNMPCCQTCAWSEVEHDDLSKVLFNHSQDCEIADDFEEECSSCEGEGTLVEGEFGDENQEYVECSYCGGEGYLRGSYEVDYEPDVSVHGFACMPPEIAGSSMFCFDGTDEGVANLKAIIPIIEECGCNIDWNGSGNARPEIRWEI